jgi:hypothetical protein
LSLLPVLSPNRLTPVTAGVKDTCAVSPAPGVAVGVAPPAVAVAVRVAVAVATPVAVTVAVADAVRVAVAVTVAVAVIDGLVVAATVGVGPTPEQLGPAVPSVHAPGAPGAQFGHGADW